MPAAGCKLTHGPRFNIIGRDLWIAFKESSGIDITYAQFSDIITLSNKKITDKVRTNVSGYKLSEGMGHMVVRRYKSAKKSIDFKKSKDLGVKVYHTNFHSFGFRVHILWMGSTLTTCKNMNIYKFVSERDFSRSVAEEALSGKVYNELGFDHYKSKRISLNIDKLSK